MSILGTAAHAAEALLAWIGTFTLSVISFFGYPGIALLMAIESSFIPFPSEAVMPFAGVLASQGEMSLVLVIVAGTFGSLIGALASYYVGYYGGRPFIEKYGKYVLLDHRDLEVAHKWFETRGELTIFICRLIPVVRQLISVPAGIAGMNIWKFSLYTTAGAGIWVSFLAIVGYKLGENWTVLEEPLRNSSLAIVVLLACGGGYIAWKHLRRFNEYWGKGK